MRQVAQARVYAAVVCAVTLLGGVVLYSGGDNRVEATRVGLTPDLDALEAQFKSILNASATARRTLHSRSRRSGKRDPRARMHATFASQVGVSVQSLLHLTDSEIAALRKEVGGGDAQMLGTSYDAEKLKAVRSPYLAKALVPGADGGDVLRAYCKAANNDCDTMVRDDLVKVVADLLGLEASSEASSTSTSIASSSGVPGAPSAAASASVVLSASGSASAAPSAVTFSRVAFIARWSLFAPEERYVLTHAKGAEMVIGTGWFTSEMVRRAALTSLGGKIDRPLETLLHTPPNALLIAVDTSTAEMFRAEQEEEPPPAIEWEMIDAQRVLTATPTALCALILAATGRDMVTDADLRNTALIELIVLMPRLALADVQAAGNATVRLLMQWALLPPLCVPPPLPLLLTLVSLHRSAALTRPRAPPPLLLLLLRRLLRPSPAAAPPPQAQILVCDRVRGPANPGATLHGEGGAQLGARRARKALQDADSDRGAPGAAAGRAGRARAASGWEAGPAALAARHAALAIVRRHVRDDRHAA
jgi:hypothetical protein